MTRLDNISIVIDVIPGTDVHVLRIMQINIEDGTQYHCDVYSELEGDFKMQEVIDRLEMLKNFKGE